MKENTSKILICIAVVVFGVVAIYQTARIEGYAITKHDSIHWLQQPFSTVKDANGNNIGLVVLGFDDNGYVHWAGKPIEQKEAKKPLTK